MRIIQITDLHIGKEGENTFDIDVRKNFLQARDAILKTPPDRIVVSGDLCYQSGEQHVYEWIKQHLEAIDVPFDIISGNHDDPAMIARVFELEGHLSDGELYYAREIDGQLFLYLDTSPGTMSERQLQWLEGHLKNWHRDLIIFMHHPPFYFGVPYMDNRYAFRNQEEIQAIFFTFPHNITAFSGHYHVEKALRVKNVLAYITPSCFFQIGQSSDAFYVDHLRIGYREIIIQQDMVMSTVNYLIPGSLPGK